MPRKPLLLGRIKSDPENLSELLPRLVILSTPERARLLDQMRKAKIPIDRLQSLFSGNPPKECPPTDEVARLKWLGVHNRPALFEEGNLTTMARLSREDQPTYQSIMEHWRACKVHNRTAIHDAICARARELARVAMPDGSPVVVVTDSEGALPVVDSIADAIKRTMPGTLFMSGGQFVREGASGLVPVTPHWLGMTMEAGGVAFIAEWRTKTSSRALPPWGLLQAFIDVADRYGFPDVPGRASR
jgi:hypothetical protein